MNKITRIIFLDNIKGKVVIAYTVVLAIMAWASLLLQDNTSKASLTILNILLFIVPLVSLLYTTIYLYNSREFVVMLLSQPLRRKRIWSSLFTGVSCSMLAAFLVGIALPVCLFIPAAQAAVITLCGCAVTMVFVSVAFLTTMQTSDKARGIGIAILLWLVFTMLWDSALLYFLFVFDSWPIEKPVMAMLMLNPLDLARFQVIMQMDASAMLGYSGAAFKEFLGATTGMTASVILMALWIVLPFMASLRRFKRKDL